MKIPKPKTKTFHQSGHNVLIPIEDIRRFGIATALDNIPFVELTAASVRVDIASFEKDVRGWFESAGYTVILKEIKNRNRRILGCGSYKSDYVLHPLRHGEIVECFVNKSTEYNVVIMLNGNLRLAHGYPARFWRVTLSPYRLIVKRLTDQEAAIVVPAKELADLRKSAAENKPTGSRVRAWRIDAHRKIPTSSN